MTLLASDAWVVLSPSKHPSEIQSRDEIVERLHSIVVPAAPEGCTACESDW